MSWHATEWARAQRTGSPTAKAVLAYLAERANNDGECWPSVDLIAAETELGRRTVIRQIAALETGGWLAVIRSRRGNRYRLAVVTKRHQDEQSDGAGAALDSATVTPQKCQPDTSKVPKRHPNRQEPSSNRQGTGERARKRATRLPADWQPSQADIDFVLKEGLDHGHIQRAADRFRDYWIAQPDPKGRKLDWAATWRYWIRGDADKLRPSYQGNREAARMVGGRRTQREIQQDMAQAAAAVVHRRRLRPTEGAECTAGGLVRGGAQVVSAFIERGTGS